jgi:hypothetical protein
MADAGVFLPDERQFRKDVGAGPFLLGEARGRWHLLETMWPIALIAITAAPRNGAPPHYVLRFDLTKYPEQAPTARLWDADVRAPLPVDRWPAGTSRVPAVFRHDWQDGTCLYLPCDRLTAAGHPDWPNLHPSEIWRPGCDITHYLGQVSELLNSSDYQGWRRV